MSFFGFLSPSKPSAPPTGQSQSPSSNRPPWKEDELQAQNPFGRISTPTGIDRTRSIASPAAVAASKYMTGYATNDMNERNHAETAYDFHIEATEADVIFAPPPDRTLITPQARRARAAEARMTSATDDEDDEDEDEECGFTRFLNHRPTGNKNDMEIQVEWEKGAPTWEPEANLHRDAPDSLFAYWESQGGRPLNPDDPDMFDIFAIRKHSKNKKRLQVEWLGYDKSEWTWLPSEAVEETAADVVEAYWKNQKQKK